MTMTAERRADTEAELQYENPFADFPTYEEMQKIRQKEQEQSSVAEMFDNPFADDDYQGQHEPKQETSVSEMFDNPFADDYQPRHISKEQQERRIVSRKIVKAGERSTIYKLEMSDGKEGTEIESDYQEIASNFRKQHEDMKKDFSLDLSMIGFSTDLALIDATRGDCFNDANSEQRAALMEDYGKLRGRLDNPNTPDDEKQLIKDYLDQMKGSALDFIQTQYEQSKDSDKQNERLKAELEELQDTLERSKKNFEECYQDYEKALKTVNGILEDSRYYDELPVAVNKLKRAIEDAFDAAKKFRENNNNYGDAMSHNKSQIGEDEFRQAIRQCDQYEDTIQQALKTLNNADEFAHDTGRKAEMYANF